MNKNPNGFSSVGYKLIYSFLAILSITTIAIIVAVFVINKINHSQASLTDSVIPSLVGANELTSVATSIVEKSLSMNTSLNSDELFKVKDETKYLTKLLSKLLLEIDAEEHMHIEMNTMQHTVDELNDNVDDKFNVITRFAQEKHDYENYIISMRNSFQILLDQFLAIKIEQELKLSELVDGLSPSVNDNSIFHIHNIKNSIYDVEKANDHIAKLNIINKSLKNLSDSHSKENILLYKQEFNHALRVIVRTVVNIKDSLSKDILIPQMQNLITLGQDANDVFELKLRIINLEKELINSSNENISLLHKLNEDLKILVDKVHSDTKVASDILSENISLSRTILIVLLLIAIVISSVIVWQYIYKNVVLKLLSLAKITDKLSQEEFNFKIEKNGNDEFSSILETLDKLRIRSREREIIDNQLQEQAMRLNRSNEDLKQFAYVASHDLQEPLRMIGSYVQLLKKRYAGKIDDKADKFINYTVDGCHRMQSLIDGLLKFSRIDIDDEDMEFVDMNDVLNDITRELSIRIKETNSKVSWSDMPNVYARPSQIRTVIRNLVANAIKYNQSDIPEIRIDGEIVDQGKVKFSIEDNGIGVEAEYQDKIFVIFKRLHTRSEYSGTGIGLSICKKIIERHGGEIALTSKPGQGSIFTFTFPSILHHETVFKNAIAS